MLLGGGPGGGVRARHRGRCPERVGQCFDLERVDEKARLGRHEHGRATGASGDDRAATGHRLERRLPKRLDQAGLADDVGGGDSRRELVGRVPYDRMPDEIAGAHVVCQPSLIEPVGQAVLEAMACGRSVVATRTGGPPEFVPPEAGVLVDPLDEEALTDALRVAAAMPCPNPAARAAAEGHDVRLQAEKVERILSKAASERR